MSHRTKRSKHAPNTKSNTRNHLKPKPSSSSMRKKKREPAPLAKQERPAGAMRLNKAIAESGMASRRQADVLIADGRVVVNGHRAAMGQFVQPHDHIAVDGKVIRQQVKRVYLAFNKPVGIECTTDLRVADNIIDYIGYHERIFPIGRLDKDSEGLILLTNDGDIVNPILRAGGAHEKEYIVRVNKPISDQFLSDMAAGVRILDTMTLPCTVTRIGVRVFSIVLVQGLNRQIRRMTETLGYRVVSLKRIRIMNMTLGKLKLGSYRTLSSREIDELMQLIGHSEDDA